MITLFLRRLLERHDADPGVRCLHVIHHRAGDGSVGSMTLGELVEKSGMAAARLRMVGVVPTDRVLLCLPSSEAFAAWFLGILQLGAVPVPLPSVSAFGVKGMLLGRIRGVIADARPKAIVADAGTAHYLAESEHSTTGFEAIIDADEPWSEKPSLLSRGELDLDPDPDRAALIQYTSGSTGKPRGVVVTHANLAANLRASAEAMQLTREDVVLSWLPLYHDMGLIGCLLQGLYSGLPTYLMQPLAFATRPATWLREMSLRRATLTVAPNFAYSLCLRKVHDDELEGIDLSAWRLAFNGAEPVDAQTAQQFVDRFSKFKLRGTAMFPVYGLAEATLSVAFPDPGDGLLVEHVERASIRAGEKARPAVGPGLEAASFVSVGRPLPGHEVEIRDPEKGSRLGERAVGEIVVRGPSVSPYYFLADQLAPERREWLRTGDLGYMAEGRLFVVDRIKDLIIVAGRSYIPSDVERALFGVEGVRMGRVVAFGVRDPETGTEAVVIAAEAPGRLQSTVTHIETAMRTVLNDMFGLMPKDVIIVAPGTLPRTSSGKIMRRAARDLYLEGVLETKRRRGSPLARLTSAVRRWGAR